MHFKIFIVNVLIISSLCSYSQTLWTGEKIKISKGNFKDWLLEENQDRITDSVWLTRADDKGLFNIVTESAYNKRDNSSPHGTEWAVGSIADGIENLTFTSWFRSNKKPPPEEVGVAKVLHLIEEDIYIDITITEWSAGGGGSGTTFGGGFAYERSTDPNLTKVEFQVNHFKVFPNPALNVIQIKGLQGPVKYRIFNFQGQLVQIGTTGPTSLIDIVNLNPGIYVAQLEGMGTMKFIKK